MTIVSKFGPVDIMLASWAHSASTSAMQDALNLFGHSDTISFALGLPSPDCFPIQAFKRAFTNTLDNLPGAMQYGPPSAALRSHVASLMQRRGVRCNESDIFLTSGAQQAVDLIVALLLDRGRPIISEEFAYPGFQQVIEFYKPEMLLVPTDTKSGMDVDKVEWYLVQGAKPAFIYAIPDGHNPLGISLSEEKRIKLLALAQKYRVPIIEEDPYGFLSYVKTPLKPLRAREADLVFYIGSFSKILAPSFRIGWVVIPPSLTRHLSILKESSDINTATFSQHIVARILDSLCLPNHLTHLCSEYKIRRDTMLKHLVKYFPAGSQWIVPDSGVFVWVKLPEPLNTSRLARKAIQEYRVSFMPGSAFCIRKGATDAQNTLRLNFSFPSISHINEGMSRLGEMFASSDL